MFPLAENAGRAGRPLSGNRVSFCGNRVSASGNRVSFRGARGSRGSRGLGASGGTADADAESKFCQSHFCPELIFRSRIARGENVNQARRRRNEKNEKSEWRKRKPQQRKSTKNPRKKTKNRCSERGSHNSANARKIHEKTKNRSTDGASHNNANARKIHEKTVSHKDRPPTSRKKNATNPGPPKILEGTKKTKKFSFSRKIHEKSQCKTGKLTKNDLSC